MNDGGPVSPRIEMKYVNGVPTIETLDGGMSLRDSFAIEALNGLLSVSRSGEGGLYYDPPGSRGHTADNNHFFIPRSSAGKWAECAYRLADAMLAERAKLQPQEREP